MARAALNWSADELATAAGVGRNTIARIEAGCTVRAGTAERVRRALADAGIRFSRSPKSRVTVSVIVAEEELKPADAVT